MFWKNFSHQFGPGIIMASSCVGGSHIIASTQAGAYYGYQLAFFISSFDQIYLIYMSEENQAMKSGKEKDKI